MEESDTYLAIIDMGREMQTKEGILRLGIRRFGPADQTVADSLQNIADLERLERIYDRILDASNWQDLLDTP